MVLVEHWGFGVRHVQLLLLLICGTVGAILIRAMDAAMVMVETDSSTSNFTLFDDTFRQKVKAWTFEQKYILKNGSTVARFLAALLAGLYSTRWNLKYFLLLDFAVLSLQSYLIPVIARKVAYDYLLLIVLAQGFCYGMIPPITTAILARWTPYMEVGRTVTLVLSCRFLGYFFVYALAVFLRTSLAGWHTLFYIVGNLGLLWCVAWFTFGFQDPKGCFYLSVKEKTFIFEHIKYLSADPQKKGRHIPWSGILTSFPVFGILATQLSSTWIFEMAFETTLTVDYFYEHQGLSIDRTMETQYLIPTAIPIVQLAAAFVVDALVSKNVYPVSSIRKTCNSIGCWGASLALLWLCYDAKPEINAAFYLLFMFLAIFTKLGSNLAYYELTRDYSGLIHGLIDFVAFIPLAFFIPIMSPILPTRNVDFDAVSAFYKNLWYAASCPMFVGNFIYIVISTRDRRIEYAGRRITRQSVTSYFQD